MTAAATHSHSDSLTSLASLSGAAVSLTSRLLLHGPPRLIRHHHHLLRCRCNRVCAAPAHPAAAAGAAAAAAAAAAMRSSCPSHGVCRPSCRRCRRCRLRACVTCSPSRWMSCSWRCSSTLAPLPSPHPACSESQTPSRRRRLPASPTRTSAPATCRRTSGSAWSSWSTAASSWRAMRGAKSRRAAGRVACWVIMWPEGRTPPRRLICQPHAACSARLCAAVRAGAQGAHAQLPAGPWSRVTSTASGIAQQRRRAASTATHTAATCHSMPSSTRPCA